MTPPNPRSPGRTRRALGLAALLAAALTASAGATTPLPFTPGLSQRVDDTFFGPDGELSPSKVEVYRARIAQRQSEAYALLTAHALERHKPERARLRAAKRKIISLYGSILQPRGWLDALTSAPDAVTARRIAARLLEFDRALLVAGKRPNSIEAIEHLWALTRPWDVPTRTRPSQVHLEAVNLVDPRSGEFYEADELRALVEEGRDLSRLDPPSGSPNGSFWNNPGRVRNRRPVVAYNQGGDPLHEGLRARFPKRARFKSIRRTQTKPKFEVEIQRGGLSQTYKLKVGGEVHSEATVNALLATLGFNVDVTRHVKDFRIDIDDDFDVPKLKKRWRSYFEGYRTHMSFAFDDLIEEKRDEEGRYLLAKVGVLEERRRLIRRVGPWNFGDLGNEARREVRALLVFSSWIRNTDLKEYANNKLAVRLDVPPPALYHIHHDLGHSLGGLLPERLNAISWEWARPKLGGGLRLDSYSAQKNSQRRAITWADARWMGRLIAQLSRAQIREAVAYGGWPEPAARLLVEKLVARRNDMVESLELLGEATPSGPIELLAVDRELTTEDGAVRDGVLVQEEFDDSTVPLAEYWESLLSPVIDKALLLTVGVVQASVGQVVELVFDDRSVGLSKGLVAELVINLRRDVVENPKPVSYDDYFIARDTLRIGARLGGGLVARGEATYWREYTLLHPVGTEREARFARGTIIDLLLPLHARRGELPEKYVLLRESYLDGRARAITDDLSGGSLPVGAEISLGRARIRRDVVARNSDEIRVFEDTRIRDVAAWRAFAKAVFVRIPLVAGSGARGHLHGTLHVLDDAFREDPAATEAALARVLREGDTEALSALAPGVGVRSKFRERSVWAGIFNLFQSTRWNRVDEVELDFGERADASPNDGPRLFTQFVGELSHAWNLLDLGEEAAARVHAVVPHDDEERAALELRFRTVDFDVRQDELADGYLAFANRLAGEVEDEDAPSRAHALPDERRLLPLTPELHSYNGRWGHLRIDTRYGFRDAGAEALANIEADALWRELARDPELNAHDVARARRALAKRHPVERRVALRRVPSHVRRVAERTHFALRHLKAAREATSRDERFRHLVDALETSAFRTGHTWDPALLAALRRTAGTDKISVSARIRPPKWRENMLVGDVHIIGATRDKRLKPRHGPLLFNPRTPVDEYRMLDWLTEAVEEADPREAERKKAKKQRKKNEKKKTKKKPKKNKKSKKKKKERDSENEKRENETPHEPDEPNPSTEVPRAGSDL